MPLKPELLALLACPDDDHGPLADATVGGAEVLRCGSCGKAYPIDDGIPVLLLDDAIPAGADDRT